MRRAFVAVVVIIVVAVAIVYAAREYVKSGPGYPLMSLRLELHDNEIILGVDFVTPQGESIPAGDWLYSVSTTYGSYNWVDGTVELKAPPSIDVSVGTYTSGTYYVSLKHKSGHIYFSDWDVTVP